MALPNLLQNYLIELNGQPAGRLFEMSGGGVQADVISETVGGNRIHKHIGTIKYEDITLTCGTGMAQGFYDWISDMVGGGAKRKDGAIVAMGANLKPQSRLEFNEALITSVVMPKCDAGSKDAAYIAISISPERTHRITSDLTQNTGVHVSGLAKSWHINDFKLTIDGLESDCAHVRSIGPLSAGVKLVDTPTGEKRDSERAPSDREDYSDLVITLNNNDANGFYQWLEDSVVKGNTDERRGVLQYFAPGASNPYFKVELLGLGPYKMDGIKPVDPNTAMSMTFRIFCQGMKFSAGASAIT